MEMNDSVDSINEVDSCTMCWSKTVVDGCTPTIKNHTATLVGRKLYVFGGYDGRRNHNNVHVLDSETLKWETLTNIKGQVPDGRNGHTCTLADNKLFIIGGWLGCGPLAASDLHVLELDTMHWREPEVQGSPPGPCNMHTTDYIQNPEAKIDALFLFRGGNGREYLNDLHILDIKNMIWTEPKVTGKLPLPRANHSSAVIGTRLYIFGGWDGQRRLNDVHVLNSTTMVWSSLVVYGNPPSPRAGMTFTPVRGKIFLFGGSGPQAKCFNDLQVFNPANNTWLETVAQEDGNEKRSDEDKSKASESESHHSDYDDSLSVASGGGKNMQQQPDNPNAEPYNTDIVIVGRGPGRRAGHTTTLIGRKLFVFGGSYGSDYLSDFHELDTDPAPNVRVNVPSSIEMFQKCLRKFINSPEFSDVVFVVEGKKLYAHKVVLSLLSERFRAMFSSGFKEQQAREIVVPDISYSVFVMLLEYLYTGLPPPNMNILIKRGQEYVLHEDNLTTATELLQVADQFMLDHLKQVCENMLQKAVREDIVDLLLEVAERTNAPQLEAVCLHFIRNRKNKAISPDITDNANKLHHMNLSEKAEPKSDSIDDDSLQVVCNDSE